VKDAFNLQARETGIPVKKGVYEIFSYLSSRKITMGLASSTRGERVIPQLTDAKLLAYFSAVVTGDMVRYSKPEPEIFLLCAEQMGVSPADTYVIEDSFNGITAAHRAGMMPIMVPDLKQPNEAIRAMTVTVEKDLHDVVKFLSEK
jgi:HAD superfamily hydrolase (TIGR01509 family)